MTEAIRTAAPEIVLSACDTASLYPPAEAFLAAGLFGEAARTIEALLARPSEGAFRMGARAMKQAIVDKLKESGGPILARVNMLDFPEAPTAPAIDNPTRWFRATSPDAEWWSGGFDSREDAIADTAAIRPIYISRACRMVPDLEAMNLFDGEEIVERMQESEAWGEDGWEGAGDTDELTRRLNATLARWFAETCSLTGAQLDFVGEMEEVK